MFMGPVRRILDVQAPVEMQIPDRVPDAVSLYGCGNSPAAAPTTPERETEPVTS